MLELDTSTAGGKPAVHACRLLHVCCVCMYACSATTKAGVLKDCQGACKRRKPLTAFYTDKCVCIDCILGDRKLARRAASQGLKDWYDGVKADGGVKSGDC